VCVLLASSYGRREEGLNTTKYAKERRPEVKMQFVRSAHLFPTTIYHYIYLEIENPRELKTEK
jgi:hypothetical protein